MYVLKIFYSFIKNYKFTVILYIIFTILAFPLEAIVVPQIYSHFFEILSQNTKIDVFLKFFFIILFFMIIINVSNTLTTYIESFMIPELNEYVINYIFKNLLIKYENDYTELEIGKIISRLSTVPQYLKEFMVNFLVWVFPRAITIIVINIYFFYVNFQLGVLSLILLALFLYFNLKYFNSCTVISKDRHLLFEDKNQNTMDKLANTYSIYSSGNVNKEISKYENNTKTYTNKFKDNLLCLHKSTIATNILTVFVYILLNSLTVYLFLKKKISYTNLIAIFITIIYYTPCIVTINATIPELIHNYGALTAIDTFVKELYDVHNKKEKSTDKKYIKIDKGEIIINNLNFGYKNSSLFKNFYLTIKQNEKVAIIGNSGNGKSTLIKIIMGYYGVPDNTIFIDGTDINKFNLNDIRPQISYVNQNNKLFDTTLLENIQYGNNMSEKEIIELMKKIKVDNIFKNLKDGLNTKVGVEGNNLSGGQRQLVHILRSIAKKNKIVILDEPTSAIDKENTINVLNAINELSKNSTVILITHDKSILSFVDRIITLDSGKIIDDRKLEKKDVHPTTSSFY